jgi:hypothetical protein
MMHESNNSHNSIGDSNKKSYNAMKISPLGSLADLTEAMNFGMYADLMGGRMMLP